MKTIFIYTLIIASFSIKMQGQSIYSFECVAMAINNQDGAGFSELVPMMDPDENIVLNLDNQTVTLNSVVHIKYDIIEHYEKYINENGDTVFEMLATDSSEEECLISLVHTVDEDMITEIYFRYDKLITAFLVKPKE